MGPTIFSKTSREHSLTAHLRIWYIPDSDDVGLNASVSWDQWEPESLLNEQGGGSAILPSHDFLAKLAEAQGHSGRSRLEINDRVTLEIEEGSISFWDAGAFSPTQAKVTLVLNEANFLFLDALSIIEDGYQRKKSVRDVEYTVVEDLLLNLTAENPDLLHTYHPREFEYFVAALLTKLGFSNVRLSRFWNDSGRDIWCTYCEGDRIHVVVVEVKHHSRRAVGLEVIDRLNGVRDRDGASKGIVVTNSAFSRSARYHYGTNRSHVALIDYDCLTEFLAKSGRWIRTPSNLWTPQEQSKRYSGPVYTDR